MSSFSMLNCSCFVHAYDFTTDLNELSLNMEVDDNDVTTFQGSGFRARRGGLRNAELELSGFWQSNATTEVTDAPDVQAFPDLGVSDRVVTITPNETEGEPSYVLNGGKFNYELLGAVGDATPFTLSMMNTHPHGLVRGQLARARGDVSATGALGSVVNLGAPTSTQFVYCAFHIFTAGTTITVQVQSDNGAGFGSPTTQATIGPLTSAGGTWMTRVAGPLAGETHWRLNVSAITGTFNVAGTIAVQ